jgi:predicted ferric reductase
LETLKANPTTLNVELHYCIRNQDTDAFVPRLVALCADIPAVRLHIHSARRGAALKAKSLSDTKNAEIWFCGPSGFADALRNGLRDIGRYPRFHQEAFEMR